MTTDTTAPVLLQERIGDVLLLTLNRPEKHNALNAAVHHWLGDAVARAPEEGVKVIVLTGAGEKSFCSGGDMAEMTGLDQNQTPLPPKEERKNGTIEIANTPLPVIAAINGYCYGGGLRLALVCDIRLASSNATFRSPGAEYGLVVGASMLPRLVGASTAKEWIFTTRVFDAEEARAAGATIEPELLFAGRFPFYAIDNMEGIAVCARDGETRLTVLSDNNFNTSLQRTLLLQFALRD